MTTLAQETDIAAILQDFRGDPQEASALAEFLGFEPLPNPQDQLAGPLSGGLRQFFRQRDDRFGVHQLFRVGRQRAQPADVGLFVGVLSDWGYRSSDRDRARRRIARALVEQVPERRSLALLVPPPNYPRKEAELVFPRTPIQESGQGSSSTVTSIRAHLELDNPTRFHRDLLRGLRIPSGANLLQVSRQWHQEFSVERVTTRFYQEYASVRDRMVKAFLSHNLEHPYIKKLDKDDAERQGRAWATRQMGRVLFLWFLQAKRWLGEPDGQGSPTYLLDLWERRNGEYYSSLLEPLFFDALATGSRGDDQTFGFIPYLNGGLFRRNALEDSINDGGPISLPDDVFEPADENSLLGLLSRYRFTTRESTPDDQSVDPDPELLGRVFENLYQGDERHDTGTYYTPREIVHFMCREALDGHLRDAASVDQAILDALRETAVGSRDELQPLDGVPVDQLVDALETVRVCDPAVGSGAFLLGTIQEMVTLRRGILFSQRSYVEPEELYNLVSDWKRRIIENSLYGVDINPEAVEICRLRLWLSMVLDLDKPPLGRDGWALPNLDFQIVAGDSLVDRVAGVTFKESWPPPQGLQLGMELQTNLQRLETNIAQRRAEFDRTQRNPKSSQGTAGHHCPGPARNYPIASGRRLGKANDDLAALKKSAKPSKTALNRASKLVERINSLLKDLEARDFTLVQKPFLWPIAFPDVLRDGAANSGFDIVLANPPYVRMEKIDNEDELAYGEAFPEVRAPRADLLVYFYARALQILKPSGWLAFITSNSFTKRKYGEGLRQHLAEQMTIKTVVDFGEVKVFDATVEPYVLVGHKTVPYSDSTVAGHNLYPLLARELSSRGSVEPVREEIQRLPEHLAVEMSVFPQNRLTGSEWRIEDEEINRLFERLTNQGKSLGEFVNRHLYMGIKTGLNEAFVIDQAKRDELIEEDSRSIELIKPWLRGKDIGRWKAESSGLYIIFTNRGVDIEKYPAILEHLKWFRRFRDEKGVEKGLEKRATADVHPWYELQQPQEGIYQEFAAPKIVWPDIAREVRFASDTDGSYLDMTCFTIPTGSQWLLALLNSDLSEFLLCQLTSSLRGGFLRPKRQYMTRLPIVTPNPTTQRQLAAIAASGVAGKPIDEDELNSIVYDLYGLSPAEVRLVEGWFERRSLESSHK